MIQVAFQITDLGREILLRAENPTGSQVTDEELEILKKFSAMWELLKRHKEYTFWGGALEIIRIYRSTKNLRPGDVFLSGSLRGPPAPETESIE